MGALILPLGACGGGAVKPLMPTPVLFTELGIDPVAHIPEAERFPPRRVYYATTRARTDDIRTVEYGNTPADTISVGLTLIGFGNPTLSWEELQRVSSEADRAETVVLSVNGVIEAGGFDPTMSVAQAGGGDAAGWWLEDLDDAIRDARDRDLLIYVHGSKVSFYNGCAFAAQLDHFMGRDMTSLAFCWPSRQNIVAYALGSDVQRAENASASLASLIELVSARTDAERIHVLAWSAGARVLTGALTMLRDRHPDEDEEALRSRFRLKTAYFAAGDYPRDRFIEMLPKLSDVAERVVVSVSSRDDALVSAKTFMGGDVRLGQKGGELSEEQIDTLAQLDGLEVIDVSEGSEFRGFDITGHDYWFSHPWASTDVLLTIRSDLTPADRGLEQRDEIVWYLPEDYPQRLRARRGTPLRDQR